MTFRQSCHTNNNGSVFEVERRSRFRLKRAYTGWSKKEDIALQMVTLSIVERFSKF